MTKIHQNQKRCPTSHFFVKFMNIVGCWMTYLMLLCLSHVTEVCCTPMKCDCWTHFYVFNFCNTFKFINFNEKILLHPNHLTSPMVLWGQATKNCHLYSNGNELSHPSQCLFLMTSYSGGLHCWKLPTPSYNFCYFVVVAGGGVLQFSQYCLSQCSINQVKNEYLFSSQII